MIFSYVFNPLRPKFLMKALHFCIPVEIGNVFQTFHLSSRSPEKVKTRPECICSSVDPDIVESEDNRQEMFYLKLS